MELKSRENDTQIIYKDEVIDNIPVDQYTDIITFFAMQYMKIKNVDKILIKDAKGKGLLITEIGG